MSERLTEDILMKNESKFSGLNRSLLRRNPDLFIVGYVSRLDYGTEFTEADVYNGYSNIGGYIKDESKFMNYLKDKLHSIVCDYDFDLKLTTNGYIKIES